jgi:hypothetical protein
LREKRKDLKRPEGLSNLLESLLFYAGWLQNFNRKYKY